MRQISYTSRKMIEISEAEHLRFMQHRHKYYASVLHIKTLEVNQSKGYVTKEGLNNFLSQYGLKLRKEKTK